jgi:molybdopterin-guanine dinucleotide biosynthesis protein B
MIAPVDLLLIEGFKREAHARIEIFRRDNGKAPIWPEDSGVVGLVSDLADPPAHLPHAHIDDIAAAADLVAAHAEDVAAVFARLGKR